jgi:capsular exopolysaccharide synthesis family protein
MVRITLAESRASLVDLRDYLRLLRRRWRQITLCVVLAVAAATAVSYAASPMYAATSQVFVSTTTAAAGDNSSGLNQGGQFAQQRVKSYADIVNSPMVLAPVIKDLGLNTTPQVLARSVSASAPLDTVLINIVARNADAALAQRVANDVAKQFTQEAASLETPAGQTTSPVKLSVVREADLPQAPISPRKKLNLVLGLLLGLAVGVGGALLRETLDTTVKAPDVAEELVGAPMLGAITFDPEAAKRPLVVHVAPNSTRAEAFRQMRTNLQFVDIEHPLRSVVVTSSIPGEGKSTTTCNLAITLAQAGVRVVLIEGDLRRPRVADYMGIEGAVGLTSVLLGRAHLDDALQAWGDGNLQVLASGPLPPNPSELLGSAGMAHLLRELEGKVDLILIDAPPLLPVTDAAVLGAICSGVLMLVRSNSTRREQLARATSTVNAVGATILGTILNMVPTKGPDAYAYGYGYGYGGRYYSRPGGTGRLARDEVQIGASSGPGNFAGRRQAEGSRDQVPAAAPAAPSVGASPPITEPVYPPAPAAPSYAPVPPPGGSQSASANVLPASESERESSPGLWSRLTGDRPNN